MPTELLTREDLKSLKINYGNPHLLHLEKQGLFPGRIYLGEGRQVRWIASEIEAHLAERMAARNARVAAQQAA